MPIGETQQETQKRLVRFGFSLGRDSVHTCRTMMLGELEALLAYTGTPDADKSDYCQAIIQDNCLQKRTVKTRQLSYKHLVKLYSLDKNVLLFRALLYFWSREHEGHPLLAFLCSYARDPLLQSTAPFLLEKMAGERVYREDLEAFIREQYPDRFSAVTVMSTAQHINATWTYSGHLRGCIIKRRTLVTPTPASVAYALLLGYLSGVRGELLFQTEYIKLLDCSLETAMALARQAGANGWLVFKHMDTVVEILFPTLLAREELE